MFPGHYSDSWGVTEFMGFICLEWEEIVQKRVDQQLHGGLLDLHNCWCPEEERSAASSGQPRGHPQYRGCWREVWKPDPESHLSPSDASFNNQESRRFWRSLAYQTCSCHFWGVFRSSPAWFAGFVSPGVVLSDPVTYCYVLQWTVTSSCWTEDRESSINLSRKKVTYTPHRLWAKCLQTWILFFPVLKLRLIFAPALTWRRQCTSESRSLLVAAPNVPLWAIRPKITQCLDGHGQGWPWWAPPEAWAALSNSTSCCHVPREQQITFTPCFQRSW